MIYVFLADGFEVTEALTTVDILRRGNLEVKTVAVGTNDLEVTSSHNITVVADINEKEITKENLEGVILPGGMPGTLNLEKSGIVKEYINYCVENNLILGAICAAPSVLGKMGILNGKKATCFPGFEEYLENADFTEDFSITAGKIVTAKGMGATIPFGLQLLKLFRDEETANTVYGTLQCPYNYV
ncbi:MAG: DJ-1 family glyoxalase III [Acutalibacteraceae bacterium]|nr:DJ-1 family glyoxalase III [Acutalibacteraceae bacterium]